MKKLLKRAGLEGKQTVFLFTDTQIVNETFLEVSASGICSFWHPSVPRVFGKLRVALYIYWRIGCLVTNSFRPT